MTVYNVLMADDDIKSRVAGRIKFNLYPELENIITPYIVIDEVDDPLPHEYGDNDNLALSYLIQVDVYASTRAERDEISYRISRLLKEELGMTNTSNAKPEYDSDYKLYQSARRYEGVFYREELNLN